MKNEEKKGYDVQPSAFRLSPSLREWVQGWAWRVLGLVAVLGLGLWGLIAIGSWTRDQLRQQEAYLFPFAEVECPAPPGLERTDFLAEVRYLAEIPVKVPLLEKNLSRRLAQAFALHPWVEKVEGVKIDPPRKIQADLVYRIPVLVVSGEQFQGVVDGLGILLPNCAPRAGLPTFLGVKPPAGPAGTPWGDERVEAAARLAGFLRSHWSSLPPRCRIETDGKNLSVFLEDRAAPFSWGGPPGKESPGEMPAAKKLERLLRFARDKP